MFGIGDTIVYGNQGVFCIENICPQSIGGITADYYLLRSKIDSRSVIYVPCGNEKLLSRMRKVLTAEEVDRLIDDIPKLGDMWIENEHERSESYKSILNSGDRTMLLGLICTLHRYRTRCQERGRKMHQRDERIFKEAERLIYDEFSLVLGIDKKDVVPYIASKLER